MPKIKLYGHLRRLAGEKEIRATGTNLDVVLFNMIEQFPALDGVLMDDGQIRPHFTITVNGIIVKDLDASLSNDDVVAVFPPIAGG